MFSIKKRTLSLILFIRIIVLAIFFMIFFKFFFPIFDHSALLFDPDTRQTFLTLVPNQKKDIESDIEKKIISTISEKKTDQENNFQSNIKNIDDGQPWGIAKQIGEHTWTMKVGQDEFMTTSKELLTALNSYRVKHGSQNLVWDQKLSGYAQSRAVYFDSIKKLDAHKGFNDFLENENGFNELGFTWLGENASFGYQLNGVHLIEWIYAGDEDHDLNQLDSRWDHVGIGIVNTATCLIFATGKM